MKMRTSTIRRWWDWPAALLLVGAILTAATRLASTEWTENLSIVQTTAFFGVIAGLALGASRYSSRITGLLATVYGGFIVCWQLGSILDENMLWSERLLTLLKRLGIIIYELVNHQTVLDSLLFIVLMNLLFWVLAAYAGYVLVRYADAWKAIVPSGLALFVIHYYDPLVARRTWYLAFFVFFGLVLVARMAFVQQHARWKDTRTSLPPHLSLDFIRFAILFASAIVLLSWTAPALANALPVAERLWRPVRSTWNDAMDNFNYAFASLRSTMPVYSPVYGNNAVLGRGTKLTNTQIFIARAPVDVPPGVRFYWRARTFDQYANGQWYSNINTNYPYQPDTSELVVPQGLGRWIGKFEISSAVYMGTLFTPPQPLWVDRAGQVQYAPNPDGTVDLSSFISSPSVTPGEIYHVNASLSSPTIEQMRMAGTDYPSYITERYLQLPDNITPRTRQLAEQITAGLETPYEKAAAITNWLRNNITYTAEIEEVPPPDVEPIDWFLFDLKKGFCNYYSSAEIVMLRSLGIPARWSIGYAQGEQVTDETLQSIRENQMGFIVRQKDAHAWPEVYFPTIGWVEFEPTAAQPDIVRLVTGDLSQSSNSLNPNNNPDTPQQRDDGISSDREPSAAGANEQNRMNVVYWMLAIFAGIILLLLAIARLLPLFGLPAASVLVEKALVRIGIQPPETVQRLARHAEDNPPSRVIHLQPFPVLIEAALRKVGIRPPRFIRQWSRHAQLPPLARAYTEINRSLQRIGQPPARNDTPAERAASLGKHLPAAEDPAIRLVREYEIGTFSRIPANLEIARQSANQLQRLSLRARLERLFTRLQAPREREFQYRRRGR
jgi:transglutaminase-like putative cysteine protease